MAELTLDIDEVVLARARAAAERRATTVETILRDQLRALAAPEAVPAEMTPEQREATDWMLAQSKAYPGRTSGPLPTREETYDREIMRSR